MDVNSDEESQDNSIKHAICGTSLHCALSLDADMMSVENDASVDQATSDVEMDIESEANSNNDFGEAVRGRQGQADATSRDIQQEN